MGSGHGVCGAHSRCTCYANWQGYDCSERTCAYAKAWVDVAFDNKKAHDYAECSNRGLCDRKSGECKCFDGYTGDACRRIACPEDCSGHGTCETTAEFGAKTEATPHESIADEWYNELGDETDPGVMLGLNKYAGWDAHKTRACKCDGGWTGIACNQRMCPKGDDPLTTESADGVTEKYEVQSITVGDGRDGKKADGFFTLSFTDAYGNDWTTRPIRITDPDMVPATTGNANTDVSNAQDVTALEVRAALMEIPNHVFDDVEVNWASVNEKYDSSNTAVAYNRYTVTFISPATSGPQSLLKCNFKGCDFDGCQPRFTGIGSLDKQELQRQENVLYVDILNPLPLVTVQVAELLKMLNVPTVVSVTVRMVSVNALKDILVNLAPFKLSWFKFSFKPKLYRYIYSVKLIYLSRRIYY